MGNQIVCPSGQNWYLSDFEKMDISIEHSIYDGTFLLSFKALESKFPKRSVVVKAYKMPTNDQFDDQTYFEIQNVIRTSEAFFKRLSKLSIPGVVSNTPCIYEEGAYVVRPYFPQSLTSKMNDFPELTNYERDWIAYQILRGVQNLHNQGLFHGDIKPENILLTDRLQVQIVDPAPYKPIFIKSSQPNFFLHYFGYLGGSCCLAPERIMESSPPVHPLNFSKCDLFSTGCLLAYLYLNGRNMFNFTTIQEYQQSTDPSSFLKPLEGIQNEKIRNLIAKLLSITPNDRDLSNMDDVFPKWFKEFYDLFYEKQIATAFMEKLLTLHDTIMKILPEDASEGSLIYFNILSDVILSSGRLVSLHALINHYVDLTTKFFDIPMKLTKAIPPLFEIFERRNNLASIYAFDGISRILNSIDKIPDEFSNYHSAFLIPRLSAVLKDGWAAYFICTMPMWALSMHKLWPSFYSKLRSDVSICQYLFTVNSLIISTNSSNISDVGFIKGYLKKCSEASKYKNFDFLSTLCFFLFPLLSSSTFLPEIVNVICSFYQSFDQHSRTQFHETLEDALFTAIFANEFTENQAPEVLNSFLNLLKIPMKEIYITQLIDQTLKWSNSKNTAVATAAICVIHKLPQMYQQIYTIQYIKPVSPPPSLFSAGPISLESSQYDTLDTPMKPVKFNMKRAHTMVNKMPLIQPPIQFTPDEQLNAPLKPQTTPQRSGFTTVSGESLAHLAVAATAMAGNSTPGVSFAIPNMPVNQTAQQNENSNVQISCGALGSIKLTEKEIQRIIFTDKDTVLILYNNITLSFYTINRQQRPVLSDIQHLVHETNITCLEKIGETLICFADDENKVYSYNYKENDQNLVFTTKVPISSIVSLDEETFCFTYKNSPSLDIRKSSDFSQKLIVNCGNSPISILKVIKETPFIILVDKNENLILFDKRICLPVFTIPFSIIEKKEKAVHIRDVIPIYSPEKCEKSSENEIIFAIVLDDTIFIYNVIVQKLILVVKGIFQKVFGNGRDLFILGDNGTFVINTLQFEKSFSLFDRSIKTPLTVQRNEVGAPIIELNSNPMKSLNSHSFYINAVDGFGNTFCSGDSRGNLNLWFFQYKK